MKTLADIHQREIANFEDTNPSFKRFAREMQRVRDSAFTVIVKIDTMMQFIYVFSDKSYFTYYQPKVKSAYKARLIEKHFSYEFEKL